MLEAATHRDSELAKVLPEQGELIHDHEKLIDTMGQIAVTAHTAGLPHIGHGFHAYSNVYRHCLQNLDQFQFPDKITAELAPFARLAIDPLVSHVNGDRAGTGVWGPLYRYPKAVNARPGVAVMDFMSIHVIYDLPELLEETETLPEHKPDFIKQMRLTLSGTADEIFPDLVHIHPFLDKAGIKSIGLRVVEWDLAQSRGGAWDSWEELHEAKAAGDQASVDQIRGRNIVRAYEHLWSRRPIHNLVVCATTDIPEDIRVRDEEMNHLYPAA